MTRKIKFRQPIYGKSGKFVDWNYWGFIEQYGHTTFVGPDTHSSGIQKAFETSQQYIGLLDKNGREIYEGDIVQVECECGYKAKMPVEWRYNSYRLKQTWSHNFPSGELEFNHTERIEVIGNTTENPELLKGVEK